MRARLIFAILSTLLEEIATAVIVLWGLPQIGITLPLAVLIALMVAWGAYSVITYQLGSRALNRQQLVGLPDMVNCRGKVVIQLAPEGLVRIKGEIWAAKSEGGEINTGEEVIVIGQNRLKLVVHASNPTIHCED